MRSIALLLDKFFAVSIGYRTGVRVLALPEVERLDVPRFSLVERDRRWRLEENVVFILKPTVATPDVKKRLYWGDCVVCTPQGPRRLGKRPIDVIQIQ